MPILHANEECTARFRDALTFFCAGQRREDFTSDEMKEGKIGTRYPSSSIPVDTSSSDCPSMSERRAVAILLRRDALSKARSSSRRHWRVARHLLKRTSNRMD